MLPFNITNSTTVIKYQNIKKVYINQHLKINIPPSGTFSRSKDNIHFINDKNIKNIPSLPRTRIFQTLDLLHTLSTVAW